MCWNCPRRNVFRSSVRLCHSFHLLFFFYLIGNDESLWSHPDRTTLIRNKKGAILIPNSTFHNSQVTRGKWAPPHVTGKYSKHPHPPNAPFTIIQNRKLHCFTHLLHEHTKKNYCSPQNKLYQLKYKLLYQSTNPTSPLYHIVSHLPKIHPTYHWKREEGTKQPSGLKYLFGLPDSGSWLTLDFALF